MLIGEGAVDVDDSRAVVIEQEDGIDIGGAADGVKGFFLLPLVDEDMDDLAGTQRWFLGQCGSDLAAEERAAGIVGQEYDNSLLGSAYRRRDRACVTDRGRV